ncbi:MAG: hypothetical protein R2822_03420 [Spirosomataceae bacterium]
MNSYLVFNNGISYLTWLFIVSLVVGIALGAVGYFSWKAAQTNPARTLKAEYDVINHETESTTALGH